ncbi:MAG: DUF4440 domain-containing protein [Terriglobales bacterium]
MDGFQPEQWIDEVDLEKHPKNPPPNGRKSEPAPNLAVEELIRRLRSEMRLPQASGEEMVTAVQAVQKMALQMDTGESISAIAEAQERNTCHACGNVNPPGNRFCARCGVPLQNAPEGNAPPPSAVQLINPLTPAQGQHHYHHHYHHHFFATSEGSVAGLGADHHSADQRTAGSVPAARVRPPASGGAGLSRAEVAVRKLAQDWALACNTKHLDDLVDLYAGDALVLRPNVPAVRSTAAIRELLFSALEAGLGEVQMEPLRVEILGDLAYDVGRCSMLAPSAAGKRREERGKYVILAARQAGEWKILVDCWSSDLSLASMEPASSPGARNPAKSA